MTFASEFFRNVDIVTNALLELSTSNSDDLLRRGVGFASAQLKVQALDAIDNIQSKYKEFLKYSNTVVYHLAEVTSADEYTNSDDFDNAVDLMGKIGGQTELVLDWVSRAVPGYERTIK